MEQLFKLQKKFSTGNRIVELSANTNPNGWWSIVMNVTEFDGLEIKWQEGMQWWHSEYSSEEDERRNEENLAKLIETITVK